MADPSRASRLRYLDANDVDDGVIEYDGFDVRGAEGDSLGKVGGFIVDPEAQRVYYVVVDSGGWFRSRNFLLPIGHARLDAEGRALHVDVAKGALSSYPEFDQDRFRNFTDEELRAFDARIAAECCPDETIADSSSAPLPYENRRHYAQPGWWPAHDRRVSGAQPGT